MTAAASTTRSRRGELAADTIECLAQRFSVGPKYLAPPAPSWADWQQAVELALRAPDHAGLRPFRFVVVADPQRERLAELFADDARRRGHLPDEVAKARARAWNGPGLVALLARIREADAEVPAHEQWVCVGGALMNFLNALHLMGFGAKALSGASVADPAMRAAFCDEGETLVAWVVAGTPVRAAHAKASDAPDDAGAVLSNWRPPER